MENTDIINNAIKYAKRSCCSPDISVGEIAEKAGFSLDYFGRIFLAHTGFTVMGYVNYQRLKHAAILLRKTDKTVLEIALEVGFESHEGFIKSFKKRYGVTPSDYRVENMSKPLKLGDISDTAVARIFLYENPDLNILPDIAWDELLKHDFKRYVYLYETAAAQGMKLAALKGAENTLICVGTVGDKPLLQIFCDDMDRCADMLKRFPDAELFTALSSDELKETFENKGIKPENVCTISRYCGEKPKYNLPDGITVKRLFAEDIPTVEKVKDALPKGYAIHLTSPSEYDDPNVLEYGIFREGEPIMFAGCGISDFAGTPINDSIRFYRISEKPENSVYKQVFAAIIADIITLGAVPYDNIQCGRYAKENGGFTAEEFGFEPVCYCYRI